MHRLGALERCAGLPDALRAFDGDGRQVAGELVKLVVNDAALIRDKGGHRGGKYQTVRLTGAFAAICRGRLRHNGIVACGNSSASR